MTSPLGTRDNATRPQQDMIAARKAHAKRNLRRSIAISAFGLLVASAVVTLMMLTSRPAASTLADQPLTNSGDTQGMSADMPGMDMGSGSSDVPAADPTPAPTSDPGSGDMPGMAGDMNGMDMYPVPKDIPATKPTPSPHSSDMPGMTGGMPGMSGEDGHSETAVANRPLAPVLGTFGGGTSAVMLAAGLLRRRDHSRDLAKKAARAARRSQK